MQAMTKQRHMDMLNGPLWSKLPRYALPVAATGILGSCSTRPTSPSSVTSRVSCARSPWPLSAQTVRSSGCC